MKATRTARANPSSMVNRRRLKSSGCPIALIFRARLHDCQAEPRPPGPTSSTIVNPGESVEDPVLLIAGNPRAPVRYLQDHLAVVSAADYGHPVPFPCELHRVLHERIQGEADPLAIRIHHAGGVDPDFPPPGRGNAPPAPALLYELFHVHGFAMQEIRILGRSEYQQALGNSGQAAQLVQDDFGVIRCLAALGSGPDQLGMTSGHRDGSSKLV